MECDQLLERAVELVLVLLTSHWPYMENNLYLGWFEYLREKVFNPTTDWRSLDSSSEKDVRECASTVAKG